MYASNYESAIKIILTARKHINNTYIFFYIYLFYMTHIKSQTII